MRRAERTLDILRDLARRPGHDEVKADFRQLLVEEFGEDIGATHFEYITLKGRIDALIGRTVFEAKSNLDKEWPDVVRKMPEYLAERESAEGERFVGIASDGLKWVVCEREGESLVKLKETVLDPSQPEYFLAWLDGALALKSSLPPDALNIRMELGQDSVAFRRASSELARLWEQLQSDPAVALKRQLGPRSSGWCTVETSKATRSGCSTAIW